MLETVVAHAIVTGDRAKVVPEVLEYLGRAIGFYESREPAS
jgi:hypothetical protein